MDRAVPSSVTCSIGRLTVQAALLRLQIFQFDFGCKNSIIGQTLIGDFCLGPVRNSKKTLWEGSLVL